ncbi:mannosyltransferase family protein [Frankia sp. EI5c]|uniref:mannosyltransferase family protein n=1 Tax=Frankia sp. EI5c TaxID=683316 RepID=UPI001F5B2A88|nr:mannosyltransferase family protein [Frankia sp. EI5c]
MGPADVPADTPRAAGGAPGRPPRPPRPPRPAGRRRGGTGRHGSAGAGRRAGARARRWYLREVLVAWVAARVVVAAALALTRFLADSVREDNAVTLDTTDLLGWDAGWYLTIADHGYDAAGDESRRFFPLLPMLVRLLSLPGLAGHSGAVLLTLVNVLALAFALVLVGVARAEGFDEDTIRRLIWISALAPPAFVLVMGYAEALAGLLAAAALLGARTRRWEIAAAAGLLGGLCRPLGLLLVVPVAIEAARGLPLPVIRQRLGAAGAPGLGARPPVGPGGARDLLGRLGAVLAPVLGAGSYLAWSASAHGDGLAPLTMQRDAARHGSTANPLSTVLDAARGAVHGEVGTALHVPWLLLAAVALVVMFRTLPVSYALWSTLVFAAVLTGSNLDSSERYLYGAFPFLLVAAAVTARRELWTFVITVSAAAMTVYATLAFTLAYVP